MHWAFRSVIALVHHRVEGMEGHNKLQMRWWYSVDAADGEGWVKGREGGDAMWDVH
jgi:hypothetical protein